MSFLTKKQVMKVTFMICQKKTPKSVPVSEIRKHLKFTKGKGKAHPFIIHNSCPLANCTEKVREYA